MDRGSNKAEREAAFQKLQSERVAKNLEEDRERDAEERQERKQIRQEEREEREQVRQAGAREGARSGGELPMSKTGRGVLRSPGPYFCLYSP